MNQKAVIAMSGGVDSSVAAYLMKEKGYECIGITIKTFNETGDGIKRENTCCLIVFHACNDLLQQYHNP